MFKPYQKFKSKLLEEIMDSGKWADFVSPTLDESEKMNILSSMLRCGSVRGLTGISNLEEASEWLEKTLKLLESIQNLSKHCIRTNSGSLKKWISFCEKSVSTFKAHPSKKVLDLIERQAFHSSTMMECINKGKSVDGLCKELFSLMSNSVSSQGIRILESLVDHSKFVKGLEKEFDINVVKYEPIRDGVFIYLDRESTEKLNDVVANYNSYITRVADDFGYLLLRKGAASDIEYGNFGENLSCWMFVYAPVTKEKEVEGEPEVLSKSDFKTLKLSERWGR